MGTPARPSRAVASLRSCGFAALTLDCRSCGPGFGGLSGEAELWATEGLGGPPPLGGPIAERLSTVSTAVLVLAWSYCARQRCRSATARRSIRV